MQLSNSWREKPLPRPRKTAQAQARNRPAKPKSQHDGTPENVRTAPPPPLSREETFKVQPEIQTATNPLNAAAPSERADIGAACRTVKRFPPKRLAASMAAGARRALSEPRR